MAAMLHLVCSNCSKEFDRKKGKRPPSKHNTYFCCRDCGFEWKRKRRTLITVTCAHCGIAHERMPSEIRPGSDGDLFCSMECRKEFRSQRRVKLACDMCGKAYDRARSNSYDGQKHYFCSNECRQGWEKRNNEQSLCRQCGTAIVRTQSDIETSKGRFCGMECREAWEAAQWFTINCDECDKEFERQQSAMRERNFCCVECKSQWVGRLLQGENSPNWRGGHGSYRGPNWARQSQAARRRDNHKCQHCGVGEKNLGIKLHVHHITPFRLFGYIRNQNDHYEEANRLTNLITLCPSCHAKAEAGKIPLQPPLL